MPFLFCFYMSRWSVLGVLFAYPCCHFVFENDVNDGNFLMCQYLKRSVGGPLLFFSLHAVKDFSFVCDLWPLFAEPINFWQLLSLVTCSYLYFKRAIGFPTWVVWRHVMQAQLFPPFLCELIPGERMCMLISYSSTACVVTFQKSWKWLCGLYNWILKPFTINYFRK